MRKDILLLTCLLLTLGLGAQSSPIVINPNPVVVTGITASNFEGVGHSFAINNTGTGFVARWKRTVVQMTDGWQSAICDKNVCYFPSVGTQTFQFNPGEEARIDVHAYPNGIQGSAVIEVQVFNTTDTTQSAVGVYYFNQSPTGVTDVQQDWVKVYPNPTDGLFTIAGAEEVGRVDIFNQAGQLVRQFVYGDNQWYSLAGLPRGSYTVRLIATSGQAVVTRMMNKY